MTRKIVLIPTALLCILVGLYPAIYFLLDRKFGLLQSKPDELLSDAAWNVGFYTHIILGGIALLVGWLQFVDAIRIKRPGIHRKIGYIYVTSVLLSAIAGFVIAMSATGGLVAVLGFSLLAVCWFFSTVKAYASIIKGKIAAHEKWMIYSYAACFAAVTLRIYLPLLMYIFKDFTTAYLIVSWACWVPNLVVAFFINRKIAG